MPARCLCGLAEADAIAVSNGKPGSNCRAIGDRDTVIRDNPNVPTATVRATRHHRALRTQQHGVRVAGFNQRYRTG